MNLFKCVGTSLAEDYGLSTVSFEEFHLICSEFLIKAIESGNWYIGVAEAQKNIVSHMYLQLIHKVPRPGKTSDPYYGYVTNVYTRLAFRSRGIGTEIHVAMEKWSKENGVEFLILWPSSTSFMKKMDLLNVKKRWKNIGDYIARG